MDSPAPSPALFFETINGLQRTEALRAAIELDLFTHLASGQKTADGLASSCKASPRGIRILADYLTILGFLHKQGNAYELTRDSQVFLTRQSPGYLGNSLEFLLTPDMRKAYEHLTEAVRCGGTALPKEGTVSHDNPIWVPFARGMTPMMQMPAQLLTDLIGGDPQQPLRVLDVAAGHGIFGITIASRYFNATITALDWPNVLAVATENAQRAGVANRHRLLPGSAFEVDWGGPYDLVLLTNFLHHFDQATCKELASRSFAALAPGGRAIILEFIPHPDRVSPPDTATFALTMLATTPHGDAYTFAEYQDIFASAGFLRSEFHPLPPTMQQAVVSTRA